MTCLLDDLPSICLVGRRYFFQMKARLTRIMTIRYIIVAITSGVQILGCSAESDMLALVSVTQSNTGWMRKA